MNWDGRNIKRNEIDVKHIYRVEAIKFYHLEMGSEEERKDDSSTSSNWDGDIINEHGIITWRADLILGNGKFEVFLSRQVLEVDVKNLTIEIRVREINL